eukprot:TRINITY_DN12602_c2_g1_i1.p1 TRINITY_DN12602_c2_g1~~TRINITY_DN12602_c2_g1_i1.p1  ORF type:complete len:1025 (+),score=352.82 TRINITY_DN12602_c2_g1_i1:83-3076(+)
MASPSPTSSGEKSPMPPGSPVFYGEDEDSSEAWGPGLLAENRARAVVDFLAVRWHGAVVLVVMVLLAGISAATGAFDFFSNAADPMTFKPSTHTPVRSAYDILEADYTHLTHMDVDVVLIKRRDGKSVVGPETRAFCEFLNTTMSGWHNPAVLSLDWYDKFAHDGALQPLATQYLSKDNTSMVFTMKVLMTGKNPAKPGSNSGDFISDTRDLLDSSESDPRFKSLDFVLTGLLPTQQVADAQMMTEMLKDNMITGPVIFLVFWHRVGSVRLLILPLVCVVLTLLLAWGIGNAMALQTQVMSSVPQMMVFLAMAMSIDYSFFLLSRFQEERQKGGDMRTSVSRALLHSGGIVAVSGTVLSVCWLAMCFFPVFGVDTIGYANAACVVMCVLTNLIVTPTSLLVFNRFFENASFVPVIPFLRRPLFCPQRGQPIYPSDVQDQAAVQPQPADGECTINFTDTGFVIHARSEDGDEDDSEADQTQPLTKENAEARFDREFSRRARYYRWIAERVTRWPGKLLLPILVYVVFAAGCVELRNFSFGLGLEVDYGSGAPARAHDEVMDTYPSGVFQVPVLLIARGKPGMIWTPDYFNRSCELGTSLANMRYVLGSSVRGISWTQTQKDKATGQYKTQCMMMGGNDKPMDPSEYAGPFFAEHILANVGFAEELNKLAAEDPAKCVSTCEQRVGPEFSSNCTTVCDLFLLDGAQIVNGAKLYSYLVPQVTTPDNSSALVSFMLNFKPFSTECRDLTRDLRDLATAANVYSEIDWDVFHPCMMEVDSERYVMDRFPYVLSLTLLLIFVIIALRFGAAFIPFKMAATVVVPILFVYGIASAVYVDGALDWLGLRPFSKTSAISWLVPVCSVFMMIGLALDYDIFLFGRVYELRSGTPGRGPCGNRRAIIGALEQTGPVISAAGAIMALAFTGMFFIDNLFLNQVGFVFIVGVLVDTFLVRTVLVPAVLSWVGWLNWWPHAMLPLDDDDEVQYLRDDGDAAGEVPHPSDL